MENRGTPHIVIMYILIALLAGVLVYTGSRVFETNPTTDGIWQCNTVSCSKFVNPQEWVSKNCARAILPNGSTSTSCTVLLDGINTSIPLEVVNLTFVGQQCEIVTCVQEINVRSANYTITLNQQQR